MHTEHNSYLTQKEAQRLVSRAFDGQQQRKTARGPFRLSLTLSLFSSPCRPFVELDERRVRRPLSSALGRSRRLSVLPRIAAAVAAVVVVSHKVVLRRAAGRQGQRTGQRSLAGVVGFTGALYPRVLHRKE